MSPKAAEMQSGYCPAIGGQHHPELHPQGAQLNSITGLQDSGAYAGLEAQRGALMSSTGCFGGTSPSGRFGLNVAQGSFSSSAQSMFLWK
jgi:hypothetical protein